MHKYHLISFEADFKMEKQRDDILSKDKVYGGATWETIKVEDLHNMCREAIQQCLSLNPSFSNRFENLRSQTPLDRKNERKWLTDLVDAWYTKKWNNRRGALDAVKKTNNPKKRRAPSCESCGQILHCSTCDNTIPEVWLFVIPMLMRRLKDSNWMHRYNPTGSSLPPLLRKPRLQRKAQPPLLRKLRLQQTVQPNMLPHRLRTIPHVKD